MKVTAVYPGSFDPVTLGHMDIIKRAAGIFDELVIGVLNNNAKTPLFSVQERVKMLRDVTCDIPNIRVEAFSGLLVDYAHQIGAKVIVRGLRAITDFEYELQMSQTNKRINSDVETMFFTSSVEYSYLSSSTVKEVASFGGDVSQFVHPVVADAIYQKFDYSGRRLNP